MTLKSIFHSLNASGPAVLALCLFSTSVQAQDLVMFGGIQRQGQLTLESAPGTTSNFLQTFDPRTFGVFGARFHHGMIIGGEHTLAYAPNFVQSNSNALIYHSNLIVQAPFPVFKPYATGGVGLVHSGGTGATSFGTEFALNYGGGLKLMAGPIGVNMDLRGYTVPKLSVPLFHTQDRLNFVQVSAGIVVSWK